MSQPPLGATPPLPVDGRSARARRTRAAIVDACIAMVEEGDLRPTAPRVAARAGVSVRSVFQHFDDLPALHTAVAAQVAERLLVLVVPADLDQPLGVRLPAFVWHRSALLEALTPFRRAAQVHGPFSPQIQAAIAQGVVFLRQQVEAAFAPELAPLGDAARDDVLDALSAACSWNVWDALRTETGASLDRARATLERTLRAVLADAAPAAVSGHPPPPSPSAR